MLARTAPACSSTQCGVPDEVVLVETPKAAVTATLPMTGVSAAELLADANLQLALRGGVAQSLGVNTSFVVIASVTAAARRLSSAPPARRHHRRRMSGSGVSVAFEVELATADAGAVAEMAEKVSTQAATFHAFVKASAAELGVLDAVADLVVDAAAVTTEQAVTKTLPAAYDVTATLAPHLIPTFAPTPAETLPPAGPTPAPEQGFALPSTAALAGGLAGMVLLAALLVRHTTTGRGPRKVYDTVRHGSDGQVHAEPPPAADSPPQPPPAPAPVATMPGPPSQLAQSWPPAAPMPLSPQQMQLAQLAAQHAAQREQQARQALLVRQQAELRQIAYAQRQSNRQQQLDRFQRSQEPGSALAAHSSGQQQAQAQAQMQMQQQMQAQQQMQQQLPAQQAAQFDLSTAIWQQQQAAQQPLPALSLQQRAPPSVPNYLGQGALAGAAARSYPGSAAGGGAQELTTSPGALVRGLPQGRLVHAPPNYADDEQRPVTFL